MTETEKAQPRQNKGCLIALVIVGAVVAFVIIAFVYLFITSPPAEDTLLSIDFEGCSAEQAQHLGKVYKAVHADRGKFYDFPERLAISAKRDLELRANLTKIRVSDITCAMENDNACPLGATTRGWVLMGSTQFTLCAHSSETSDFCDTYASLVYANAFTRNLFDSDGPKLFEYAREVCRAREA